MRRDHFFDWSGFKYAAKVLVLCIIAGTVGRYGLLYAAQSSSTAPSLVLIQEAHPAAESLSLSLSTTTSRHIINTLTITDAVPPVGKFIAVDVVTQVLTLYQDGTAFAKYPILATGKPGSPYEISSGFYTVLKKESDHFNSVEQIDLPWSVQFYGNYFVHGWPYADDGSPVNTSYVGNGVRLSTSDAASVYTFADKGVGIFVYDPPRTTPLSPLVLDAIPTPSVSAASYIVADIDTGDVFLEQHAEKTFPIASTTRLMTALVASGAIPFDTKITIPRDALSSTKTITLKTKETFPARDLLYPLLMESNTAVAHSLAQTYGTASFIGWMNATAQALDMSSTHFSDISGTSTENISSADDLFRLASYLAHKKSFILDIARTPSKNLISGSGNTYSIQNTTAEKDTMVSVLSVPVNGAERRVAVIVLQSNNYLADTIALAHWFTQSAERGVDIAGTACITCAIVPPYRKIQL